MIEIKISINEATTLLLDRMENELEMRKKAGLMPEDYTLDDLSFKDLLDIAEVATFDLVTLIPLNVLVQDNNVCDIISKVFISLADIFQYEEFKNYSVRRAESLIAPLKELIDNANVEENFFMN
jgi:hypothetical protein